jgi:hypothetical protein
MFFTRNQVEIEVNRRVNEERERRDMYETFAELRKHICRLEQRIDALENKPPETFVIEHNG